MAEPTHENLELRADQLGQREAGRSSHWHQHFQHDSWKSDEPGSRAGLGIFIPRKLRRVLMHCVLQVPLWLLYGRRQRAFLTTLRAGRRIARIQDRVFDMDDLRQVLSLACVRNYINLQPDARHTIAVIGDGYGRLANLLLATLPKCLVVLVNLSQPLKVDLASIRRLFPGVHVLEPGAPEDLRALPSDLNVVAIPSDLSDLLGALSIDGALNVASMQEMAPPVIGDYFRLMRANPSPAVWFYCANSIEKTWADGTVVRFADYPWSPHDEVLLDELCPWAHRWYEIRPPRYTERGPFRSQHRLAYLHKEGVR